MTGQLAGLFGLPPGVTIMAPVLLLLAIAVAAQHWHGPVKRRKPV